MGHDLGYSHVQSLFLLCLFVSQSSITYFSRSSLYLPFTLKYYFLLLFVKLLAMATCHVGSRTFENRRSSLLKPLKLILFFKAEPETSKQIRALVNNSMIPTGSRDSFRDTGWFPWQMWKPMCLFSWKKSSPIPIKRMACVLFLWGISDVIDTELSRILVL